jgi:hypothetical protein
MQSTVAISIWIGRLRLTRSPISSTLLSFSFLLFGLMPPFLYNPVYNVPFKINTHAVHNPVCNLSLFDRRWWWCWWWRERRPYEVFARSNSGRAM